LKLFFGDSRILEGTDHGLFHEGFQVPVEVPAKLRDGTSNNLYPTHFHPLLPETADNGYPLLKGIRAKESQDFEHSSVGNDL